MPEKLDVDARVDALYAGPLDEFVAARDALAREVAGSGDKVGSARIKKLRRPTVAAWAVNQVARTRADDVEALTTLGDELRAATSDRDRGRIKALDHLRRERTEALVGELRATGEIDGRPLSADMLDRLAQTLTAAVMDEDAAAAVRAGRLTQALQYAGFGLVDESGEEADVVELRSAAPAGARKARRTADTKSDSEEEPQKEPEPAEPESEPEPEAEPPGKPSRKAKPDDDALAAAEREVEDSAAELDRLEALHDEAQSAADEAATAVEQHEKELQRLEAELERLTAERDAARAALEEAREAEAAAGEKVEALGKDLDDAENRAAAARRARRSARQR